ncbi:hypothetical protein [Phaeovulum sp.]|uniref:hypothetical protein n=1 Tax=Phaeovulum sp. TaxID=2934796 RepID=UPI0039E6C402
MSQVPTMGEYVTLGKSIWRTHILADFFVIWFNLAGYATLFTTEAKCIVERFMLTNAKPALFNAQQWGNRSGHSTYCFHEHACRRTVTGNWPEPGCW